MKKIAYFLSAISLFVVVILACNTKDIVLVTNIDYVTALDATKEGFVRDPLATTIKVTPEVVHPDFAYFYKYEIIEGTGFFEDQEKNAIPENENILLDVETGFTASLNYKGLSAGAHQIKITTSDNFEKFQEFTLFYTLKNLDLVWTATTTVTAVKPGNKVPITIILQNNTPDRPVTFQRKYRFTQGSGSISDDKGTAIVLDRLVAIAPGTYQIDAIANQTGTTAITFDLIDSNGQEKSQSVTFEVTETVLSNAAEINAISINGITGIISGTNIEISLAPGIDPTNLLPTIIISDKATISPVSDIAQDFTAPVTYTVTAEDGSTKEYTVTVKSNGVLSSASEILAISIDGFNGVFTGTNIEISLPEGTDLSLLQPKVIVSDKATVDPASNVVQDFTKPKIYTVTAEDGSKTNYIVEVVLVANPLSGANAITAFRLPSQVGDAIIDLTSHTIAVTVPFGTVITALVPDDIQLSPKATYTPQGPQDFSTPVTYIVTAENGDEQPWIVTVTVETGPLSSENHLSGFVISGQVGNSAVNLDNHTISAIMPFGTDLSSLTPIIDVSINATSDRTGVQNFTAPVTYIVTAENGDEQPWIVTVTVEAPRTANEIIAFTMPNEIGITRITRVAEGAPFNSVSLNVPEGTDKSSMTPNLVKISPGASYTPLGPVDFTTTSGAYTVTAENGDSKMWTILVYSGAGNNINDFEITGQVGRSIIDNTNHTVSVTMPFGSDISNITPSVGVSTDGTYAPQTAQNFNSPVTYTVTSAGGVPQDYVVTVTVLPDPNATIAIPDGNFEQALIDLGIDSDGMKNGKILKRDAEIPTMLNVGVKNISDLTGIEAFTNLVELSCAANSLTTLDMRGNLKLKVLQCTNNQLTTLNIRANTVLEDLNCNINKLTTLDISRNVKLKKLFCLINKLSTLNIGANVNLEELSCGSNTITSFDLSKNTKLALLNIFDNSATSLDLRNITNLSLLSMDATRNPGLRCIRVDDPAVATANALMKKDATAVYNTVCN